MDAADIELLEACRAGDPIALERLLTPHERPVYLLCLGILRSRDDAEDAAQEAFLRALRALPRFKGEATVRTWLYRIAVNVCLENRRLRRPTAPMSEAEWLASADVPIDVAVVDRLRALAALGSLPAHQRAVTVLKHVDGWTADEIADAMGWNRKKVENELYRARQTLNRWAIRSQGE